MKTNGFPSAPRFKGKPRLLLGLLDALLPQRVSLDASREIAVLNARSVQLTLGVANEIRRHGRLHCRIVLAGLGGRTSLVGLLEEALHLIVVPAGRSALGLDQIETRLVAELATRLDHGRKDLDTMLGVRVAGLAESSVPQCAHLEMPLVDLCPGSTKLPVLGLRRRPALGAVRVVAEHFFRL